MYSTPHSLLPIPSYYKESPMNRPFSAFFTIFVLSVLITACDSPMGLGKPVDTLAPTVVINTPADNEFIRGILLGSPVIITGRASDDLSGPDALTLSFEMYNKTAGRSIQPDNVVWEIDAEGKWRAEITITAGEGAEDYTIKVFAQDAFKNKGSAIVNVRLDIVPPWIRDASITRHPNSGFNFSSALYPNEHYVNDGYLAGEAYRNIPYLKIDEYQNEVFTLRVEIEPSYADVAASRLYVKNRDDGYLHEEELVPSGYWRGEGVDALRFPEWEISASQLAGWDPAFSAEANFMLFEVWAYSEAAWDKANDQPFPGEPGRVQKIDGTVWHPESDRPHAQINPEVFINDVIVLERSADAALAVDFYDDDRLGVIYTKLLPKLDFLALCAGLNEDEYLNSLTDPADPLGRRASLINTLQLTNDLAPATTGDGRFQRVDISSKGLELGEYRLIALARDDKSKEGYSFEDGAVESWGVYPPVSIQVSDVNAPFIFVENPEVENIFPDLIAGESFIMSGFILGRMETISLNIAWVPKALQADGLDAAITVLESNRAAALSPGESFIAANGITVWKTHLREDTEKTILNGVEYFRVEFDKNFHIIDDFQYNNNLENDDKLLVLHAANYSSQAFSTFNLLGLKTGPEIEVTRPASRGTGHDPNEDLLLSMRVSQAEGGAAVKPNSQIITDITIQETNVSFDGPTSLDGDEWVRTVTSAYIMNAYDKGSTRKYAFRAQDILGNVTEHERDIIFTDQPLLESIVCTETTGIFGIGQELRFEATFSMSVRVTQIAGQTARLKLYLANPGSNQNVPFTLYAEYDENSPSGKTIFFNYTVQEGHTTPLLCTSLDAITLSGGAIITSTAFVEADLTLKHTDGLLQSNSAIELDGDRPYITRASFAPLAGFYHSPGVSYFTNGKTITLKLIANDTVKVTGNPVAIIRCGTREMRAQYASKTTTTAGIDTLFFTHTYSDAVVEAYTPLTFLEWGGGSTYFDFPVGSAITDTAGNNMVSGGGGASLTEANRRGQAVTGYTSEQGYVKTTKPAAPTYSLHSSGSDATGGTAPLTATPLLRNDTVYVRVAGREVPNAAGLGGATLYYSLEGGSSPVPLSVSGTAAYGTAAVSDTNSALKYTPAYERSQYVVTAWQEDLAGNRSPEATHRQVTINSRWPELVSVEIGLPDGDYLRGTTLPIRLNFSDRVRRGTGSAAMSCEIYASYVPNTADIDTNTGKPREVTSVIATSTITNMYWEGETTGGYTNVLCFDWPASANVSGNFHDIKLTRITFGTSASPRFVDEYGNPLIAYSGTVAESAANANRPIGAINTAYPFQLNRPDLWIHVDGPLAISSVPAMGGDFYIPGGTGDWPFTRGDGVNLNGGILTTQTFTLTYDVPITKVAGKYITVRPHGNWALPPVLTIEEMDYLLNHPNVKNNNVYIRRLTYVDAKGASLDINGDNYDFYTKTTHGVKNTGSLARPDTTTKWVLRFRISPYSESANDRTARLREVFEAADWKVQRIHVGSNQVTLSSDRKTATITLSEALLPGRIWSVTPEPGAFTDDAGNPSGRGYAPFSYRFWSPGTAKPVIRVNRRSYGDEWDPDTAFHPWEGDIGIIGVRRQPVPAIDTEVRIDCETPGATIHYNVMRTHIQFGAANGITQIDGAYYNNVFASTTTDDETFFGFNYKPTGQPPPVPGAADGYYRYPLKTAGIEYDDEVGGWVNTYIPWDGVYPVTGGWLVRFPHFDGPTTGYAQNTIGNDNRITAVDGNGFFNTLIRPRDIQTAPSGAAPIDSNNGAPNYANLVDLRASIINNWSNTTTSKVYRTVTSTGAASYNYQNYIDNNGYFYVGEAYETWTKNVDTDADPRLYNGRRDYIVAAARKDAVSSGNVEYQGPELSASFFGNPDSASMEGVYKTTVIFREPFMYRYGNYPDCYEDFGARRIKIGGVSDIPVSTVSGFPFKGVKMSSAGPGGTVGSGPFFMMAYRLGGYDYTGTVNIGGLNTAGGVPRNHISNNYLWVSWDIVTDWYLQALGAFNSFGSAQGDARVFHMMVNVHQNHEKYTFGVSWTGLDDYDIMSEFINENYITATYGGITYRYGQWFEERK